ncbi:MAG: hypothetical protein CMO01_25685, partial [Thalassobius sp.]|nr:hypothetical protein [Thalassovita sp.]
MEFKNILNKLKTQPEAKNGIITLSFYGIYFLMAFLLEKALPSGPCTMGMGYALIFSLPIITVFLLIKNIFQKLKKDRKTKISISLHSLVIVCFYS